MVACCSKQNASRRSTQETIAMPMRTLLDVTTGHLKKQDREALQRIADSQKAEN